MAFSLDMQPVSKQATEFGKGIAFKPAKTRKFENQVKAACRDYMTRHRLKRFDEPVCVALTFRSIPPASWPKWKRAAALAGDVCHTGSRDLDNMTKAVWDGMKKIVMVDDRLVVRLLAVKQASTSVGIDVVVESYAEARARQREQQPDLGGAGSQTPKGWSGPPEGAPPGYEDWCLAGRPSLGDPEVR